MSSKVASKAAPSPSNKLPQFSKPTPMKSSSSGASDLSCPVCFETYDVDVHAPVFAQHCRHSICRKCLWDMDTHHRRQTTTPRSSSTSATRTQQTIPPIIFGTQQNQASGFGSGGVSPFGGLQPPTTTATTTTNLFSFNRASSRRQDEGCYLACPTCRKQTFDVSQQPNNLAICLLKKIGEMKEARSRRLARGAKFKKDPFLQLREKQLLSTAKGYYCEEIDLLKSQMRSLQEENTSLRAENSELLTAESAKDNINNILLNWNNLLLKATQSKLKDATSTIASLQATLEVKKVSIQKGLANARLDREHAKKTQNALFMALFVLVLFSCFSIIFALVTTPRQCCPSNCIIE